MKTKYVASRCVVENDCLGQFCEHHIKSRGAGGTDDNKNLMPLCSKHHTEIHKIGLNSFLQKYPKAKEFILENFEFDEFSKKWLLKTEEKPITEFI